MKHFLLLLFLFPVIKPVSGQTISAAAGSHIDKSAKYLFYLHGGIVQEQGIDAVSEQFGPYLYLAILDTLKNRGYYIISEPRPKDTEEAAYGAKVARQIDTLLKAGVSAENITVVGASQGAYMTLEAAHLAGNRKIRYALLGLCSDYAVNYFKEKKLSLCGNFLSIYELSDPHGTCIQLFMDQPCLSGFREIALDMNKSHGFLYQPYEEWVGPLVEWIEGK